LSEVIAVPRITGAKLFRALTEGDYQYDANDDWECENPQTVMSEMLARWNTDRMRGSPAFDDSRFMTTIVERIGKPCQTSDRRGESDAGI